MIQRLDQSPHLIVHLANLDRDGALPGGGKPSGRIQILLDPLPDTETNQSRGSENRRVDFARVHFPEARGHVAAELRDHEIRPERQELSAAPRHRIREMFRLAWEREGWPTNAMGFAHWDRLAAAALGEVTACDLPDGISVCGRERVVLVGPSQ